MIYTSNFKLENNNKETLPIHSGDTAYMCNYTEMDIFVEKYLPWHWHSEFEIDYIIEGELDFRIAEHTIPLRQGDAIFVNSNVMHDMRSKDEASGCKTYAHLFHKRYLCGTYQSQLEQRYINPILNSKQLPYYVIRPDNYHSVQMLGKVLNVVDLCAKEPFGYEFEIRHELSQLWCMLLSATEEIRAQGTIQNSPDSDRLKLMIQFINDHYMDKISLADIASAANISERECSRCFQRSLDTTPIIYLTSHRIRQAAQMLAQTSDSIIDISENCGFSSSSYFGKTFLKMMNCTPKEYRNNNR